MTRRFVSGIAAGTFALGLLTGAAGAIVARDATRATTDMAAVMAEHMSPEAMGSMMSDSVMGRGASMAPAMGPGAAQMPGSGHDAHHPSPSSKPE